jgi:thiol peroxidase
VDASKLENTTVLCISKDLPFALNRFCGAEGISNVETLSAFRSDAFDDITFIDGPLKGLLSRSVIVVDENGKVIYTEQVAETVNEPNYEAALASLK